MSILDIVKTSRALHALTNSFLLGNRRTSRGGGNRIEGRLSPLSIRSAVYMHGSNNRISLGAGLLRHSGIRIIGDHNTVIVSQGFQLMDSLLWINASHATIHLMGDNTLHNCELGVEGDGGSIFVGEKNLIGGFAWLDGRTNRTAMTRIYAGTAPITIGSDCLFSDDISMRSHDSHHILDAEGNVSNAPEPITVGDHCWIASGAAPLKGSGVGHGCVVGAKALVTRDFSGTKNALLAGMPAQVVKEGVQWKA